MVLPDTAVFIVSYAADVEGSFAVYSTVTSVISKTSKLDVVSSTTSNVVSFLRVKLVAEEVVLLYVKSTYSATSAGIVIVVVTL